VSLAAGLAIPFLAAGWSIEHFFRVFARIKVHFRKLEMASGMLLIGVGVMLMTDQFTRLNSQFTFLSRFVNAAERMIQ
jgi:hypothetical protein